MGYHNDMRHLLEASLILNFWLYFKLIRAERRTASHAAVRIVFINGMGKWMKKMNLKVNDTLPLAIQAEDKFGNATGAFDAPPAWSVADPTLGSIEASSDGLSATFTPSGKEGSTQLQVLGAAAGQQISGSLDLVLIAGDATQIVIQPGTPAAEAAPAAPAPAGG